jgi:translation initiation factor RLI1
MMTLHLKVEEDQELRAYVRDLIKGEVKAIIKEDIKAMVTEELKGIIKGSLTKRMEHIIDSEMKDQIREATGLRYCSDRAQTPVHKAMLAETGLQVSAFAQNYLRDNNGKILSDTVDLIASRVKTDAVITALVKKMVKA